MRQTADILRLVHLRRELKTSLELALAGMAPNAVTDSLATAAGLLDALSEFPPDAAPSGPLVSDVAYHNRVYEVLLDAAFVALPTTRRSGCASRVPNSRCS